MKNVRPMANLLEETLIPASRKPVSITTGYKYADHGIVLAEHRCDVAGRPDRIRAALEDFKERASLLKKVNPSVHFELTPSGASVTVWHPVRVPKGLEADVAGLSRLKQSVRELEQDVTSQLKLLEKKR